MENAFIIKYIKDSHTQQSIENTNITSLPFANSPLFHPRIVSAKKLCGGEDVKDIHELVLSRKNIQYNFKPGDTIGICPQNSKNEVNALLERLGITETADKTYEIDLIDKLKKNPIPPHVPLKGSFRELFTYHLDVRSAPKKSFLKSLIPYCLIEEDKEKLEHLCRPSNNSDYLNFLQTRRSLLSILEKFSSCKPSVEWIVTHLSRLQPRPYSLSSSPLHDDELHIIFSVETNGVCTNWLKSLINEHVNYSEVFIPIYFRKPTSFRLIDSPRPPIMLIGSGVGVAPFYSFLQYMKDQHLKSDTYLFYGCRSVNDLVLGNALQESGYLTNMFHCFSRQKDKTYVQAIVEKNQDILREILLENGLIYVCGNSNMVKDVKQVIANLIKSSESMDNLVKTGRFLTDIWT